MTTGGKSQIEDSAKGFPGPKVEDKRDWNRKASLTTTVSGSTELAEVNVKRDSGPDTVLDRTGLGTRRSSPPRHQDTKKTQSALGSKTLLVRSGLERREMNHQVTKSTK